MSDNYSLEEVNIKNDSEEIISWACLYKDVNGNYKVIYFKKNRLFFIKSIYNVSDIFEIYLKKIYQKNHYNIERIFNLIYLDNLLDELNFKKIDVEKIDIKDIF